MPHPFSVVSLPLPLRPSSVVSVLGLLLLSALSPAASLSTSARLRRIKRAPVQPAQIATGDVDRILLRPTHHIAARRGALSPNASDPDINGERLLIRWRRSPDEADGMLAPAEQRRRRRMLRKKKRRLKQLRDEIKTMSGALKRGPWVRADGTATQPHRVAAALSNTNRAGRASPQDRHEERWRRKVLAKMRLIVDRLERLERQWLVSPSSLPSLDVGGRLPVIVASTAMAPAAERRRIETAATAQRHAGASRRANKNLVAAMQSLNGENGFACATHKDCRPGRCCHRSASGGPAVCVFHALAEQSLCRDSCQCEQQLHCYRPKDNSTAPVCRHATATDILHGTYLYEPETYFSAASLLSVATTPTVSPPSRSTVSSGGSQTKSASSEQTIATAPRPTPERIMVTRRKRLGHP